MKRLVQSRWFAAMAGCLAYLAVTALLLRPSQLGLAPRPVATSSAAGSQPSWNFRNPELDQWLSELKQERERLSTREKELAELQARLDAERHELLAATQTVHLLQEDFDRNVVRLKLQEAENLKRQTKIVSGMSPDGAAAMLGQMPDEEIVGILFNLKPDAASSILDTLSKAGKADARRAAALAEKLRLVLPPEPSGPQGTPAGK